MHSEKEGIMIENSLRDKRILVVDDEPLAGPGPVVALDDLLPRRRREARHVNVMAFHPGASDRRAAA